MTQVAFLDHADDFRDDGARATEPTINANEAATSARRKKLFAALGGAVLLAGAGYWLLADGDLVATDNAYVAADSAQVTPLVSGAVVKVFVVNTQNVKRGDILIQLDDTDARLALARAEADYARARRQFGQAVATSSSLAGQVSAGAASIGQAEAQVQIATAALAKARIDLDRRAGIADGGAVSGEELTVVRNAYAAAQGNLAQAKAGLAQAVASRNSASGSLAANTAMIAGVSVDNHPDVLAAKAKLDQARIDLERTVIRAPVDGVVTNKQVQVGQRVSAGSVAMTIVPIGAVYVDANFKEGQLERVRVGQPVELVSDLYGSDVVFHGRVEGFSGGTGSAFALIPAQNATGNWIKVVQRLPVRVSLDPKELKRHPLRVGLSMEAEIDVASRRKDVR
jgi:membrane fusion protein (multidrug efflux system)